MTGDLEGRVAALEHQMAVHRAEMRGQIVDAAHQLRADDKFMQPASASFVDHASDHLLTKAGRRIFLWIFTAAAGAFLLWAGSTKFWTQ